MELNKGVELVAVDRGYLESLVLGKAHAEGQLAQAERTVAGLKKDLEQSATELSEAWVTTAMPTAFDSILIRLEPNAARAALGYLAGMNGGPLPDDHALRPVYDLLKQALMGQRSGS